MLIINKEDRIQIWTKRQNIHTCLYTPYNLNQYEINAFHILLLQHIHNNQIWTKMTKYLHLSIHAFMIKPKRDTCISDTFT